METIVVGVDGSESSVRALRFAAAEARLRRARLRVVYAWHVPALAYDAGLTAAAVDTRVFEKTAQDRLQQVLETTEIEDVEIEPVMREGRAGAVLVEESQEAELVVVGSRGLGGFRELLLGSVGHQCALHACCPVVIVPHAVRAGGRGDR
jgi:nucleotide-binding universal stress UspA family protein